MTTDDKRQNDTPVVVYATFPSLESAKRTGEHLVDRRLAACVNIIPGMIAIYQWQGERHEDSEIVMIAKSRATLVGSLTAAIRETHPYTNPAIVAWPIADGSAPYLAWIGAETASPA